MDVVTVREERARVASARGPGGAPAGCTPFLPSARGQRGRSQGPAAGPADSVQHAEATQGHVPAPGHGPWGHPRLAGTHLPRGGRAWLHRGLTCLTQDSPASQGTRLPRGGRTWLHGGRTWLHGGAPASRGTHPAPFLDPQTTSAFSEEGGRRLRSLLATTCRRFLFAEATATLPEGPGALGPSPRRADTRCSSPAWPPRCPSLYPCRQDDTPATRAVRAAGPFWILRVKVRRGDTPLPSPPPGL